MKKKKIDKEFRQKIIDKFIEKNPDTKQDQFLYRSDRECLEWICPHGVGHPIWDAQDFYGHGCCGCCKKLKRSIKCKEGN